MYYLLHMLIAYLYVTPMLFTNSYTETNGLLKIIMYSITGIVFGIIHFLINFCYGKKHNLTSLRTFLTPIFIMVMFILAYYINFASNHFPYKHINNYGFYLFVSFVIIWALISYIAITVSNCNIKKFDINNFKKIVFKNLPLKILLFAITLFMVCMLTEFIKNEILTFKYGGQFENLTCIKENVGSYESFKVVDYSDYEAHLYYITDYKPNPVGFIISLEYYNNRWNYKREYAVWSTMGSASETIWPYWWHFIYGGF